MVISSGKINKQQLKEIWLECYDDPENYVDFFFQNGFGKCKCICEETDGLILGVLYLFKCNIVPDGKPAYYWYAGGVRRDFRGRGIYRKIVSEAFRLAEEENRISLCFPAPGLENFYKKKGMSDDYLCDICHLQLSTGAKILPLKWETLSLDESIHIFRKTENTFGKGSAVWQTDVMEYVIKENQFCNGFCDKIIFEGKEYYLLGQKHNAEIIISETNILLPMMQKIKDSVISHYGASAASIKYPAGRYPKNKYGTERVLSCIGNGGFSNIDKWFVLNML